MIFSLKPALNLDVNVICSNIAIIKTSNV